MESALDVGRLGETLRRLNERAAAMEKGLAEIRELQKQMAALIEQAERLGRSGLAAEGISVAVPSESQEPLVGETATFTDAVIAVFEQHPDAYLGVGDVAQILQVSRSDTTKERVRNALYYANKQGHLHRVKGRPGKFTLKDTSTPVAAGVEGNEELNSGSSREEKGDRDDDSALLRDQGGGAGDARFHRDRDRDRTSLVGG